jgi:uncharacterized membrane protein YkoI
MDKETLWKEPTNSNIMEQMQTTNKWSSISNQKEEMSYKERRTQKKKTLESKKRDTYIRVTERKSHTQKAWREEKGREDEERNNLS